ncbi:hypothetical protein T10_9918, partial [Trichinella papuae]
LRNFIKFPVWAFDICRTEKLAYCMQIPFQSDN